MTFNLLPSGIGLINWNPRNFLFAVIGLSGPSPALPLYLKLIQYSLKKMSCLTDISINNSNSFQELCFTYEMLNQQMEFETAHDEKINLLSPSFVSKYKLAGKDRHLSYLLKTNKIFNITKITILFKCTFLIDNPYPKMQQRGQSRRVHVTQEIVLSGSS